MAAISTCVINTMVCNIFRSVLLGGRPEYLEEFRSHQ
jgi:hypothetical protein